MASRRPSPINWRQNTVTTMQMLGGIHTQGFPAKTTGLVAYWIMLPQEACGVRMPTPRKLRLDSDRMARPTRRASAAHTGATAFGRTFRRRMVAVLPPSARTARMYSFSRTESVLP